MPFRLFKRNAKKVYRAGRPPLRVRVGYFLLRLLIVALFFGFLGGLGWLGYVLQRFLLHSDYFAVREIQVAGPPLERLVARQIEGRLSRLGVQGQNLLLLKPEAVRQDLEAIPKVRSVQVEKIFPGRVRVTVAPRELAALLLSDPILGIDKEGVVIELLSARHPKALEFPFISGLQLGRPQLGDQIRSQTLTSSLLLLSCLRSRSPVLFQKSSEVHCDSENSLTLLLKGGTEIRFGSGNPIQKMPILDTFLEKMGAPEQYAYIDLRFDSQVPCKPKPTAVPQRSSAEKD
jgi:cell division septal protein FtsQ